ncbi:MAG: SDR family NAD(P)-dependent oxidoreductase [Gemmatimonadales bacterium]|nr:MAG: SDR family NAD(P)-dependent oxidoreductase [Gemmatimonadales bacterium]
MTPASAPDDPAADRKVALITGSTSGLGEALALDLAAEGWHVIVHGRNVERGEAVVEAIEAGGSGSAVFLPADFASLDEVRGLADQVRSQVDRLDLLVSNAGIWRPAEEGRLESEDGHELHFQVNYLAGYLLVEELLDLMEASAPSRIVKVSSVAQAPMDFDDVMLEQEYTDFHAYSQSKLAQIFHAMDLAERLEGTGVVPVSVHPATIMDTRLVEERGMAPRTSVDEGVEAVLAVALGDDVVAGAYYRGLERAEPHAQALDPEAREALRALSRELTGR